MPLSEEQSAAAKEWSLGLPRVLPNGELIGLHTFLFTVGLLVGVDKYSYRTRFCYSRKAIGDALDAVRFWDGQGDPPGQWIKEKGLGYERHNPRVFHGIPVVTES